MEQDQEMYFGGDGELETGDFQTEYSKYANWLREQEGPDDEAVEDERPRFAPSEPHFEEFDTVSRDTSSPIERGRSNSPQQRAKKGQWKTKWAKLAKQRNFLQREIEMSLSKLTAEGLDRAAEKTLDGGKFDDFRKSLAHETEMSQRRLSHRLSKLRENVSSLLNHVRIRGVGEIYIQKLRRLMERTENNITRFRETERVVFDKLASEESTLSSLLEDDAENVTQWEEEARKASKKGIISKRANIRPKFESSGGQSGLALQLDGIEKKLEMGGGVYGGWQDEEHERFVRVLRRLQVMEKGVPKAANALTKSLHRRIMEVLLLEIPTKSKDAILDHWDWFVQASVLIRRKKNIIADWKETRIRNGARAVEVDPETGIDKEVVRAMKRKQELEFRKQDSERRSQQRKRIEAWKESRRKEEQMSTQQAEAQKALDIAIKRREAAERDAKRQQVALFKMAKKEEDMIEEQIKEQERRARSLEVQLSARERAKQREKELQEARDRHRKKLREKAAKEERWDFAAIVSDGPSKQRLLSLRCGPEAPRDPKRLIRPTAASKRRVVTQTEREKMAKRREDVSAHDKHVPSTSGANLAKSKGFGIGNWSVSGRSVPSWRKGI